MSAGKGDTPRPYSTTAFGEGYDRIDFSSRRTETELLELAPCDECGETHRPYEPCSINLRTP